MKKFSSPRRTRVFLRPGWPGAPVMLKFPAQELCPDLQTLLVDQLATLELGLVVAVPSLRLVLVRRTEQESRVLEQ